MKAYAIAILVLLGLALAVRANPPPMPESWVALSNPFECTDTETDMGGWCRLFVNVKDDRNWVVFFDQPGIVLFIRSRNADGVTFDYLYQRPDEPPSTSL